MARLLQSLALACASLGGSRWLVHAQGPRTCSVNTATEEMTLLQVGRKAERSWRRDAPARAPPKSALLVIDMQNDFINGSLTVNDGASIIPTINELVALPGWSFIAFTLDYHPHNHLSFAVNSPYNKSDFETVEVQYTRSAQVCGAPYMDLYGGSAKAECSEAEAARSFAQKLWPAHCIQGTGGQQLHSDIVVPPSATKVRKGYTAVVDSYGAFEDNTGVTESNLEVLLREAGVEHVYTVGVALDYCVKHTSLQSVKQFATSVVLDATRPVANSTGEAALEELRLAGVGITSSYSLLSPTAAP